MCDSEVQISIGAEIVTKARIGAFGTVKCRLVGDEAVLTIANGALELVLAEPALEVLVDSAQEVLDAMVERH